MTDALNREILLSLWKIHILHHAGEGPVVGNWLLEELREHGYAISPGTLYPVLHRMEKHGWLECEAVSERGPRGRKAYSLTPRGRQVLRELRAFLRELEQELGEIRE